MASFSSYLRDGFPAPPAGEPTPWRQVRVPWGALGLFAASLIVAWAVALTWPR